MWGARWGRRAVCKLPACPLALQQPNAPPCAPSQQAFWALLLDLVACPGVAAAAALPPLAAALDVWPSAVEPASGGASGGELAALHAALQQLCCQAAEAPRDAAPDGDDGAPPPLLHERQPLAAAAFLRRLGAARWHWPVGAASSGDALRELRAALVAGTPAVPGAAGAAAAHAPAAALPEPVAVPATELAVEAGVEVEEI